MKKILCIPFLLLNLSYAEFIPWTKGCRKQIERNEEKRLSHAPFLTNDTFRAMCEHKFDPCSKGIDPSKVSKGDKIYIAADGIFAFIEKVHPKIQEPYILLSSEHPQNLPGDFLKQMQNFLNSENLAAWFCQNLTEYRHPKLFFLPLGIAPKSIKGQDYAKIEHLLNAKKTCQKKDVLCLKLYYSGQAGGNDIRSVERSYLNKKIRNKSWCYKSKQAYGLEYSNMLAKSKFVLCPRGVGLDTYRFYEALYAGAYPIVKKTSHSIFFRDLPVVILDSWDDLSQGRLKQEWERINKSSLNLSKLYSDYWLKLLEKCQKSIRMLNSCTHVLKEYK